MYDGDFVSIVPLKPFLEGDTPFPFVFGSGIPKMNGCSVVGVLVGNLKWCGPSTR